MELHLRLNNRWYGITSKAYGNNSQQTGGSNPFNPLNDIFGNFASNTSDHTSTNTSNPTDDSDAEVQDAK